MKIEEVDHGGPGGGRRQGGCVWSRAYVTRISSLTSPSTMPSMANVNNKTLIKNMLSRQKPDPNKPPKDLQNKVQLLSPHNTKQHMLKVVSIHNSGKSSLLLSLPTYLHCLYLIIRLFSNSHHPLLIICTTFLLITWTAILSQSANLSSCNFTKCYSDDLFIGVFPEVSIHKW